MRNKLGAFLAFMVLGTLVGTACAQELDRPTDKFGDFEQKLQASRVAQPLGATPGYNAASRVGAADDDSLDKRQPDPFAGMIAADSKVTAVTIFSDRARVTRTAVVEVPAGTHTIVFKDLAGFMPDTLHVNGQGKTGAVFGTVAQKQIFEKEGGSSKQERDIKAQIEELIDRRKLIDVEKQALSRESDFLTGIIQKADDGQIRLASGKDAPPPLSIKPEEWAKSTQELYDRIDDILKAQDVEDSKQRDINESISAARIELGQSLPRQRAVHCVTVPVIMEAAEKVTVELSYMMPNATWQPLYDARLTMGGDSSLVITQYAMVKQATGEDWKGVSLVLSTARPERSANQPDLSTIWMDIFKPSEPPELAFTSGVRDAKEVVGRETNDPEYIKKIQRKNEEDARAAMRNGGSSMPRPVYPVEQGALTLPATPPPPATDPLAEWRQKTEAKRIQMENEQAPEEKEAEQPDRSESSELAPLVQPEPQPQKAMFVAAQIDVGGFASEYKIPGTSTVPSGGTDVKILVGNFDAESKIEVRIEPQVSEEAYLVVENKLKGDAPVLPGKVNLFRDDAYIGQSVLPLLRPGENHDIFFGIDDQVSVEHKMVKDERSVQGLITHEAGLERAGLTEIQNLHKAPVNIVLRELAPVSRDEKLKINLDPENLMTPGYKVNGENIQGMVGWQFSMAPLEKKEVRFSWKATWPDSYDVSGL